MFGWILLGIILLLGCLAFFTPLRIVIVYGRVGENDRLHVEVTAWFRLLRFRYELPMIALRTDREGPKLLVRLKKTGPKGADGEKRDLETPELKNAYRRFQDVLERFHDLQPVMQRMMQHIRCEQLEWQTTIGIGEAAATGALTGIAWGIKSMIVSMIAHYLTMRTIPRVSVQPEWNSLIVRTRFRCSLRFMLGHAMIAGVRLLVRYRKKRRPGWAATPTGA
ncbi:DUF2953 domain-containing protein [Brevibacillus sp. SYP-B805]|uniref:DUF2953 domain-containing protein n=1 Tax=Brevibacillus sp. SYP-B805 TaxID=1578199 RepID=UPI0013EB9F0A|nr:DUF2953 domain-containing protein [Brevibacillus sp. SYP-B805]NGQ95306.1 DUF2953 domain-containing protein [Brevibacillus sp. SYP-B805]